MLLNARQLEKSSRLAYLQNQDDCSANTQVLKGYGSEIYLHLFRLKTPGGREVLQVEIAQVEHIVGTDFLPYCLVDVFGLPCADMNLGHVGVAEIPCHEHIAFVAVSVGVPLLVHSDTVDAPYGGVFHDDHIVEGDLDIGGSLEGTTEVLEILLLRLGGIYNLAARRHHL